MVFRQKKEVIVFVEKDMMAFKIWFNVIAVMIGIF